MSSFQRRLLCIVTQDSYMPRCKELAVQLSTSVKTDTSCKEKRVDGTCTLTHGCSGALQLVHARERKNRRCIEQ